MTVTWRVRFWIGGIAAVAASVAGSMLPSFAQLPPTQPGGPGVRPGGPGGAPGQPPPPRPQTVSFAADQSRWFRLLRSPSAVEITEEPAGGGASKSRGKSTSWREIALDSQYLWVLSREPSGQGELLRCPVGGGEPTVFLRGLQSPGGLFAGGGSVYWIEQTPRKLDLIASPLADPVCRLMKLDGSNSRAAAEWLGAQGFAGGGAPEAAAGSVPPLPPGSGDILGISGENLLVRMRRPISTQFALAPLNGGAVKRLEPFAGESGVQTAAFHNGTPYWTGDSAEAMPNMSLRRVRTLRSGEPATVTEWLASDGTLVSAGGRLYYVGEGVFQVPDGGGPPELVEMAYSFFGVSDGKRLVVVDAVPTRFVGAR